MATIRLVPSAYTRSSTSRVTVTNPENMYYNTDHTASNCSIRGRNSSSNTYYCFIHGFDFTQVPSNANVTGFRVLIRCYRNSYLSTSSTYAIRLASSPSSSSTISDTTMSDTITTTSGGTVYEIPTGSLTWSTLKNYGTNFSIDIPLRSTSSQYPYLYVYGAEIEVTYSASTVSVTGVSLNKNSTTIEEGSTEQLTETVAPSNATDKSVTWSTSNSSVATVSNGLVTAVSPGSANITVTTTDGGYTATCAVTVTAAQKTTYVLANSMEPGKTYVIANGNSGTIYMLSNTSGGSRQLVGVSTTVTNGQIQLTAAQEASCVVECVRYTTGNDVTITVKNGSSYLYCDNSTGLRWNAPTSLDRFWHYRDNKFWQFKSTSSDGYSDTSTEYKYYLELNSSNNFTDNHVTSPSIEDSTLPAIYIFTPYVPSTGGTVFFKSNGAWVEASRVYKKVNGSWVEQSDLSNVFSSSAHYKKGIIPRTATISGTGGAYYSHVTYNNTTYYTSGDTFTYSEGDSLNIRAESRSSMGFIVINGTTVASSTNSGVSYSWTLPDADISININDAYVTITTL